MPNDLTPGKGKNKIILDPINRPSPVKMPVIGPNNDYRDPY